MAVFCLCLALAGPMTVSASEQAADVSEEVTEDVSGENAEDEEMAWVFDDYGILTDEEYDKLNQDLADIYDGYSCDVVLWISTDTGYEDARKHAARFMQDNDIGYGDDYDGVCIYNQPDKREIYIVFRGNTQKYFPDKIQEMMIDRCMTYLKDNDMAGGYQSLIDDLTFGLERVQNGKKVRPMDIDGKSLSSSILFYFIISLVVMAVPTLLMTLYQARKMKTNVPQPNANAYETEKGLKLTEKQDMFLYSVISQTAKSKNDDNDSSSGSFSSDGESFSGSGGNY